MRKNKPRIPEETDERPKHENYIYAAKKNSKKFRIRSKSKKTPEGNSDKSQHHTSSITNKPPLRDYLKENRIKRENLARSRLEHETGKVL